MGGDDADWIGGGDENDTLFGEGGADLAVATQATISSNGAGDYDE